MNIHTLIAKHIREFFFDGNRAVSSFQQQLKDVTWQQQFQKTGTWAEQLARLIEQLPDELLTEPFTDPKNGNYYRNLHGLIGHSHYPGQITLSQKMITDGLFIQSKDMHV